MFTSLKAALNWWLFIVDSEVQNSALRVKFIAYETAQSICSLPLVWQCSICVVCRCPCRNHVFIVVPKTVTLKVWELFELCYLLVWRSGATGMITVMSVMMPYRLVELCPRFRGACCLLVSIDTQHYYDFPLSRVQIL